MQTQELCKERREVCKETGGGWKLTSACKNLTYRVFLMEWVGGG
jgi:hypothetical protein